MPDGYTYRDVELAANAYHLAMTACTAETCVGWPECPAEEEIHEEYVEAIVAALASSGRLLPEGAERHDRFLMRWYGPTLGGGAGSVDWGCDSVEHARAASKVPPTGALRGEVMSMERWDGPWRVVEPVAIKGASDG